MQKKRVGLIFGGVSAEHEVSIITFDQVYKNIDKEKYDPLPVYITEDGDWIVDDRLKDVTRYKEIFTGNKSGLAKFNRKVLPPYPLRHDTGRFFQKLIDTNLKIDIAFPLIHGSGGEDGSLQGLFELADIPYTGSPVASSAVGMDKLFQKLILKAEGLPIVRFKGFLKSRIENKNAEVRKEITDSFRFPIFVKPSSAGSSVGITKVDSADLLSAALDEASRFDRKLIVEEGVINPREINCAVMGGDGDAVASVCEEVFSEGFLDYEQKYMKGGKKGTGGGMANVSRALPAKIDETTTKKIKELAVKVFNLLDCSGSARVDFLLSQSGEITITELNSIPGSLSFYLWEESGISFKEMITKLIEQAEKSYRAKKMLKRTGQFSAVQQYLKNRDD